MRFISRALPSIERILQLLKLFIYPCEPVYMFVSSWFSAFTVQVPTEEFFAKDMGLALEMTPNYEDFSCQVPVIVVGYFR